MKNQYYGFELKDINRELLYCFIFLSLLTIEKLIINNTIIYYDIETNEIY